MSRQLEVRAPTGAPVFVAYEIDDEVSPRGRASRPGLVSATGGFFQSRSVEVLQGYASVPVRGLVVAPAYRGAAGGSFTIYDLTFEPIEGSGLRLVGLPCGAQGFVSVAELEVWPATSRRTDARVFRRLDCG